MGIIQSLLLDGKTGNEQQPESQEQFPKLHQIRKDPLVVDTLLSSLPHTSAVTLKKSHDIASAKEENYSNRDEDIGRFFIALRGFQNTLARTSVSEEIILDHHSDGFRRALPSSVTAHEEKCNNNIVGEGDKRRKRRTKRKTINTVAVAISSRVSEETKTISPSSVAAHEIRAQENSNINIVGKGRKRRTNKKSIKEVASEEIIILDQTKILLPSSITPREGAKENGGTNIVGRGEKIRKRRTKRSNKTIVVDEARCIKHYSSSQRILLVGEGDFSFSACLAMAFGIASNMIATSLNSEDYLKKNYQIAEHNLEQLTSRGCKVMHGMDATEMANHDFLKHLKFDRIVFNFPFAGFFKKLPPDSVLHRHRSLVSKFLMNAKNMINENGEIHISHKTNGVHKEWNLESIASSHGLRLIEAVKFNPIHYPGYNPKRGFGGDENFNCYPSKTFKFGLKTV